MQRQVEDRSEPHAPQAAPSEAPRTTADRRDAPHTSCSHILLRGSCSRVDGVPAVSRPRLDPHAIAAMPARMAMIEKEAPHAADATLHDTSYALPNYTVFGRFRFVVDVLEEDDRGFR